MLPGTQTPRSVAPSQLYKEPPCFAGTASEDVDEWLKQYKRVSKLNSWDSAAQLSHVVLSLTNTALLWYDNHEDTLTTWEIFEEELKKCFGDSITKKKRAEQTLSQRAQLQGETCTMYIEEILKLCRLVNPSMSEEDKVGHLLKGIAEDVYQFLIAKENLTSVAEVMQHCRTFEALKMRRIAPKFGRLANVPTVASVEASSPFDLSSTIRQIVREELLRCHEISRFGGDDSRGNEPGLPPMSWQPSVNAADVDNYQAVPQSGPASRPRFNSEQQRRNTSPTPRLHPTYAATRVYRDHDDRDGYPVLADRTEGFQQHRAFRPPPRVCYSCGLPGHISRFCDRRRLYREEPSPASYQANYRHFTPSWPTRPPASRRFRQGNFRNPSPASDRSLTPPPAPRAPRSPSPRRRLPSPHPEN